MSLAKKRPYACAYAYWPFIKYFCCFKYSFSCFLYR